MVDTEEVEAVEVVASVVDAEAGSVETEVVDEEVITIFSQIFFWKNRLFIWF